MDFEDSTWRSALKKIGVLFGMENTFPGALVDRINSMQVEDIQAEFARVGGVRIDEPSRYSVVVDRISHEMPFYRAWLKAAMLAGTQVINNPFRTSADDKFLNYTLAARLGVAVPPTVLLPHKQFPPRINDQSVCNLEYPLDWEAIFDYVGFPAYLKPFNGGGGRYVYAVNSCEEFFDIYDQTRDLCMVLQSAIHYESYFRCFVVGRSEVLVMSYDPQRPYGECYLCDAPNCDDQILSRMKKDALTLCHALGYDINTVEFAIADGVPYAIDFMNPVPDADRFSVGEAHFEWIVDAVARLAVERVQCRSEDDALASEKYPLFCGQIPQR